MTKEEIQTRLNYLIDYAIGNPIVNNPSMFTNCADDILKHIDKLQQENEKQKKILDVLKKSVIKEEFVINNFDYHFHIFVENEYYQIIKEWLEND